MLCTWHEANDRVTYCTVTLIKVCYTIHFIFKAVQTTVLLAMAIHTEFQIEFEIQRINCNEDLTMSMSYIIRV